MNREEIIPTLVRGELKIEVTLDGKPVWEIMTLGKKFRQFTYGLSCLVILALGGFCLFLGLTLESSVLAGIGVALGMVIGAVGLAIFLELFRLGSKFSRWL